MQAAKRGTGRIHLLGPLPRLERARQHAHLRYHLALEHKTKHGGCMGHQSDGNSPQVTEGGVDCVPLNLTYREIFTSHTLLYQSYGAWVLECEY